MRIRTGTSRPLENGERPEQNATEAEPNRATYDHKAMFSNSYDKQEQMRHNAGKKSMPKRHPTEIKTPAAMTKTGREGIAKIAKTRSPFVDQHVENSPRHTRSSARENIVTPLVAQRASAAVFDSPHGIIQIFVLFCQERKISQSARTPYTPVPYLSDGIETEQNKTGVS